MSKKTFYLYLSLVFASFGGVIIGYQTGVIAGVLLFLNGPYELFSFGRELLVTTILLGALVAATTSGFLSDYFGRKLTLVAFSLLGCIAAFFLMLSPSLWVMFVSRAILGLTIGAFATITPVYISETAPKENRGAFVALFQFWITVGILLAYAVNYSLSGAMCWHASFAFGLLLGILHFIMLLFIPRSSMWLFRIGKKKSANRILESLYPSATIEERRHLASIQNEIPKKTFKELFQPGLFMATMIGVTLAKLQQLSGINIVMYYGPIIFSELGFLNRGSSLLAGVIMGVVNVLSTIVSFYLIDAKGRRPILLLGTFGMAISLFVLAIWYQVSYLALVAVLVYVFFFAISLGPITFVVIAEIFPTELRGEASGMAMFANGVMNILVTISFLTLLEYMGTRGVFLLYALICAASYMFIRRYIPETKQKSLEEIQEFWKK